MNAIELLKLQSARAHEAITEKLEGVDEAMSWAAIPAREGEYLHTDGSIIAIVQHVACCKHVYGSIAFRGGGEVRWRDAMARLRAIDTDWALTRAYLEEAHQYWHSTWAGLSDSDLDGLYSYHTGDKRPAWRLISVVIGHDEYHAGQIELVKSTQPPGVKPPVFDWDVEEGYVKDSPFW